jgi:hypothetical protein
MILRANGGRSQGTSALLRALVEFEAFGCLRPRWVRWSRHCQYSSPSLVIEVEGTGHVKAFELMV